MTELTDDDRERYGWQLDVPGFGEAGQRRLKNAAVLISRIGGVGGTAALHLAAAGVGRLIIAHAGSLRRDDLNRQILMSAAWIGRPRVERAAHRLRELNPQIDIVTVPENITEESAPNLVAQADVVVDAAPLFAERFALNRACVRFRRPMIEAAMYALEFTITTILPGRTPCIACLTPDAPAWWQRRFPVIGAVAGTVGALAAIEVIKVLTGCGEPLAGRLLAGDVARNHFRTIEVKRRHDCAVCGS